MSSGRPPTLWCDLMLALSPPPDSTMSGYSVPCTRNRGASSPLVPAPRSRAASSNTRMNVSPMILRLRSGSITSSSAPRNRSAAFTCTRSTWNWRRNVSSTCSASSRRSSPVSTNTHVSWSPIALCTSAAATAESTPPDSPQITRSSPTCARISSTACSMIDEFVHVGRQSHTSNRNALSMSCPRSVCATSGWNCTPYTRALAVLERRDRRAGRRRGDHEPVGRARRSRRRGSSRRSARRASR